MPPPRTLCLALALLALALSCAGGGSQAGRPEAGTGAVGDAQADGDAAVSPSARTCQQIRLCVWFCSSPSDDPCVEKCIAGSGAAAEAAYRAVAACTASHCPDGGFYCGCEQQCQFEGQCQSETQACVAGITDLMCEQNCH